MLRSWLFGLLLLGAAGCWAPQAAIAEDAPPKLAQECIDAKITTEADCDALLKKLGKLPHKPADKTKGGKAGESGSSPALPKACVDAGIKTQADCDAYIAAEKAKAKTPPAPKVQSNVTPPAATTPPPSTPAATVSTPKPPQLPKDCLAAGITTLADCDAFHAGQSNKTKPLTTSKSKPTTDNNANGSATPAVSTPTVKLPKDCLAAGLTTQADCDALHAAEKAKQHTTAGTKTTTSGSPAVTTPAGQPTTSTTQAPISTGKTINATLPKDCVDAGLKTQADCDALLAMEKAKGHTAPGKTPGTPAVGAPPSQPTTSTTTTTTAPAASGKPANVTLAQDCIAAGLKTQADCDAYLKTQKSTKSTQNGVPATNAPVIAQPTEIVPVLPKGVTRAQVAPLLDSAKLAKTGVAPRVTTPPTPTPTTPPPSNDKAAQAALTPLAAPAIDKQPGTPIAPTSKAASVQLPPNVTIINQTTINQTIVNNITNNNPAPPPAPPPANPIGLNIGIVVQIGGGQLFVDSSGRDQYRIADRDRDRTIYEQLSGQRYRETIFRPDGSRIVTIYDRDGDVLRRSRFEPDGREIILAYFDYSTDPDLGQWRDPGDDLPPLQLQVPVEDYVLDADQADEGQIQLFFARPPVEHLRRLYSISEVERSARLRDMVPRVELGDLTFDTGSADLGPDQIGALSSVAHAMLALLQRNPAETFLIEGHTDTVGSDASNLVLSDERAASVAQILTQAYHIPPENLATQGYGDHFLKIQADGPERLNRRVVIRRITPLITAASS